MTGESLVAAAEIEIGEHVTFSFLGVTFNADTIWSTAIAGLVVIGLGFWMRSKLTSKVPSKIQLMWEAIVGEVTRQVEENLGRVNPFVVPLAIALFVFILVSNWLELIPSNHLLPSPTADVNLTYALGLLVIIGVHIFSVRERGLKGYVKHYFQPYPIMFPLNLIEEIVKPFTLALRLFGNIFAGGIMIAIIGLIPIWGFWGPNVVWKLFDMFIGLIQAFIFALLTVIYFGMAGEGHGDADDDHKSAAEPQPELSEAH
ncbi:MAG: F0F1 ATP synthase subunit A [Propionibacteriales bacterium]|nr:F0F1 ATP synthase subunit A [Propionibacteriales bacterium]